MYYVLTAVLQISRSGSLQSTAVWSKRELRGSPTSRGGGFTVRPNESVTRARTAGSLTRRSAASKVIHGHNEDFWPLNKRDAKTRIQQSLQDTSDIVLSAVELDFGSQQSDMAHKITIDKKMRPYSRGPLAAATKNLHMNSGYKIKYPNGQSQKPAVKPLSPQQGSVSAGLSMLTTGSKKRLSNSPR